MGAIYEDAHSAYLVDQYNDIHIHISNISMINIVIHVSDIFSEHIKIHLVLL